MLPYLELADWLRTSRRKPQHGPRGLAHALSRSEGVTVAELLEARELLEVPAAGLAAARRTNKELMLVRETIPHLVHEIPTERIYEVNRAFHESLMLLTIDCCTP